MDAAKILITLLLLETAVFLVFYFKDVFTHKEEFKNIKWVSSILIGGICNFLDCLGIGSYATSTTAFKWTKCVSDDLIPGTLNVAYAGSVVTQAVVFMGKVEVDSITLIAMVAAAVIGSVVGTKVISKWNINMIRRALGTAMIALAIVMFCKNTGIGPFGIMGTATGLSGMKLIIGVVGNFFLGAFMIVGLGLYNPCMALVFALGMSTEVVFPIMMASCAFLMPAAGIEFVKEGKYDRGNSIVLFVAGVVGALIACFVITSLPLKTLTYVVCVVMIFGAYTFFKDAAKASK